MDRIRIGRAGGWAGVLAGLTGLAAAVFLLAVPPAVDATLYNYPLSRTAFAVVQTLFCLHHLVMAWALWAFWTAGLAGAGRFAAVGAWSAIGTLTFLGIWELVAISGSGLPYPSEQTGWLDAGYGIASLAVGVGLVLLGVAAVRAGILTGVERWSVLVTGIYVFVPMTPGIMAGFVIGRIVIGVWLLLFAGIGWAMLDWARRANAAEGPVTGAAAVR